MGLLDTLKWATGSKPRPDYLASPFTDGQLSKIVWSDVFGAEYLPLSRAEAMSIPAVSKARQLICNTVARLPLRVLNKDGLLPDEQQPSWTYRTDGELSPYLRMTWTLDDLLFYGSALWIVARGKEGQILSAEYVPFDAWKVTDGVVRVYDEPLDPSRYIHIPAPIEGLLDRASRSLRQARDIEEAVANKVRNPIPVTELHLTEAADLTPDEAKELAQDFNKARRDPDGTTVVTPSGVELHVHGTLSADLMTEGRNATRLDVANHTGIPAALLDGSVSEASLTYSTQEGRRNEFVDYGLSQWIEAVQGALSNDRVVPRGQRVRFDLTDFLALAPTPTGAVVND